MKRPGETTTGTTTGTTTTGKRPGIGKPPGGGSGGIGKPTTGNQLPSRRSGNGLLASIIGDVRASNARRVTGTVKSGGKSITREDTMSREERAVEARKKFERETRERLEREVLGGSSEDAFCEFEPMEKQWRNVVHEIAAELKLHSESVEIGEDGEKFVIVQKKAPEIEKDVETLRNELAQRERAASKAKKGEGLSDKAPQFAAADAELTVVGTVKRDLRSVEETIADMRKAKSKDASAE